MAVEHKTDWIWFSNTSRTKLLRLLSDFASKIPKGALVLDAGAGDQLYKYLFEHLNYESADFLQVDKEYAKPTYICDLASIPVENNRFDYIIFSQVLEHIAEPQPVINELYRVLKPGGTIICTCPFFYEEHEQPYDFFRYTQFALRRLFDAAGFKITSVEHMEGYLTTFAYQLQLAYKHLPVRPSKIGAPWAYIFAPLFLVMKLSSALLAGILYRIDRIEGLNPFGYPKNYVVVAVKS